MALSSADKGRLRPSFFFLLTVAQAALAQQPVYRCGQEYTNAPADPDRCERLAPQAVTVIPGTRVQGAGTASGTSAPPPRAEASAGQRQRDDMARTIVGAELDKARQRHAALLQAYQKMPEGGDDPRKDQIRAEVERTRRDIDSLQRELERRPFPTATP